MAFFVNVVLIVTLKLLGVVMGQTQVERDDNIEPFALLCRIYNVAKNPPITYVDTVDVFKIVDEIDTLNTSLWDEKLSNETEQMATSVGAQLPHTITREATLAQLSLNQITQRAHKVLEEIKKMKVTENIEKAKAEFHKVIFGDGGNESNLCHATVNGMDNRSVACGDTGLSSKGASAGKNLLVDFFCLCAQRTDKTEGVNQVCGFYVGRISHFYGWSEQGPWGSSTMWASIKGGCGKYMQQHPKSTSEARHILDQFLKHLKTGGVYRQIECENGCRKGTNAKVKESDRKAGMLGTGVTVSAGSDFTCDGKEGGKKGNSGGPSPGGVCVYYGTEPEWKNIDWLKQFKAALNTVDAINNDTASFQRQIEKLQMLLHRAEEIYETAKVITEVQNPMGLTALQNVSGNLTAYNATRTRSYSYSRHAHFALPWVLFL